MSHMRRLPAPLLKVRWRRLQLLCASDCLNFFREFGLRVIGAGESSANWCDRHGGRARHELRNVNITTSPSYHNTMAKTLVGALALAALPSALGFRNTSPFALFSTAEYASR
jgi:hypothetical protein